MRISQPICFQNWALFTQQKVTGWPCTASPCSRRRRGRCSVCPGRGPRTRRTWPGSGPARCWCCGGTWSWSCELSCTDCTVIGTWTLYTGDRGARECQARFGQMGNHLLVFSTPPIVRGSEPWRWRSPADWALGTAQVCDRREISYLHCYLCYCHLPWSWTGSYNTKKDRNSQCRYV